MLKDFPVKIFALFLAALFWFFVVTLENDYFKLSESVPVRPFNLGEQLALVNDLGTVSLTLRASNPDVFRTLSADDFDVYVDLDSQGVGEKDLEILVRSKKPEVSVVRTEPARVTLVIEPVQTTQTALSYRLSGELRKGLAVESVSLSSQFVTVRAAESVLKNIDHAEADLKLSEQMGGGTISKDVEIVVLDSQGFPLSQAFVDKDVKVTANVTISEEKREQDVGIKADLTGSVSDGFVKSVRTTPSVVAVEGSGKLLQKIETLETEPVDLADLSGVGVQIQKRKLILPEGVSLKSGEPELIEIEITIEAY
ncbi:MAG: CdaR family protein [Patescibacteria group bacterium]